MRKHRGGADPRRHTSLCSVIDKRLCIVYCCPTASRPGPREPHVELLPPCVREAQCYVGILSSRWINVTHTPYFFFGCRLERLGPTLEIIFSFSLFHFLLHNQTQHWGWTPNYIHYKTASSMFSFVRGQSIDILYDKHIFDVMTPPTRTQ